MIDILLCGCAGRLGRAVTAVVAVREDCRVIAGIDLNHDATIPFPVYSAPQEFQAKRVKANVIIDFSNPAALPGLLEYAVASDTPTVIATTGLNDAQTALVKRAAERVPLFFSANMSLGVSLLRELSKKAARVLGDSFDIEIVELHHNQKLDAPSGTALMLADAIASEFENGLRYEYDRHSKREKRAKAEIGIHAVRGGTIVGEHEVIFAGHDEILKLSHSARSKEVFATGAVNAALFLLNKPAGLYQMADLVGDEA